MLTAKRWNTPMTLYRDTATGKIWTDSELTASLAEEINGLDDETFLKQDVELRGGAAIYDYIVECCLVGVYSRVDDGESTAYRRTGDGQVFYAAEMESVYAQDVPTIKSEARAQVTFNGWLDEVLQRGEFEVINADSFSGP